MSKASRWTGEKNKRRCELIDKQFFDGGLTGEEAEELDGLQTQMLAWRRKVAPLPIEDAKQTLEKLKRKSMKKPEHPHRLRQMQCNRLD